MLLSHKNLEDASSSISNPIDNYTFYLWLFLNKFMCILHIVKAISSLWIWIFSFSFIYTHKSIVFEDQPTMNEDKKNAFFDWLDLYNNKILQITSSLELPLSFKAR
jgi:hypothetical protein